MNEKIKNKQIMTGMSFMGIRLIFNDFDATKEQNEYYGGTL